MYHGPRLRFDHTIGNVLRERDLMICTNEHVVQLDLNTN